MKINLNITFTHYFVYLLNSFVYFISLQIYIELISIIVNISMRIACKIIRFHLSANIEKHSTTIHRRVSFSIHFHRVPLRVRLKKKRTLWQPFRRRFIETDNFAAWYGEREKEINSTLTTIHVVELSKCVSYCMQLLAQYNHLVL